MLRAACLSVACSGGFYVGACNKLINLAHAGARSQDSLVRAWSDPSRNSDRPDNLYIRHIHSCIRQ